MMFQPGSRSRALTNRAIGFVLRKVAPMFWAKLTYEHIVRSVTDPKNWKPVIITEEDLDREEEELADVSGEASC